MKTMIFAIMFALIGMNAAVAADNTKMNTIPSPTALVETELLPQFKAKVKMEAEGWYGKCGCEQASEHCASKFERSEKPAA